MNKNILKFLVVIFSIIILAGLVMYINNDRKIAFPHYKQAFYGLEGSMYVVQNQKFDLPLVFVDSFEMSEMSSGENIKSIKIIEKNSKEINIERWSISNKLKGDDYFFRDIQLEICLDEIGIYKPETLVLTFLDDFEKKFYFGDFEIYCHDNEYYNNNQYVGINMHVDHVGSSKNIDKFHLNALAVYLSPYLDGLTVKGIDLGINSFGIDTDNIRVEQMKYDLNTVSNYIESRLANNEEWASKVRSINIVENIQQLKEKTIKPFYVNQITSENDEGTLVILPLARLRDAELNHMKIFNITFHIEVDGEEKIVFDYQPFYAMPFLFDESSIIEYLWEAGV